MARKAGGKNEKVDYWADEVIAEIRSEGKIPCNRTSIKEAALREAIKKRTNEKTGETDLTGLINMMKLYHGSNPDKLDKKMAKLEAQLAELKAAREAIE